MEKKECTKKEMTKTVKHLFAKVLQLDDAEVNSQHTFFTLGGNSLQLIQLCRDIEETFCLKFNTALLFKYNRVMDVVKLIAFLQRHPKLLKNYPKTSPKSLHASMAFEQQQIWIAHHLSKNKSTYNIPWVIEITGNLDETRLSLALETIVTKQPLLKANIQNHANTPKMLFHHYVPFNFTQVDSDENTLQQEIDAVINRPFDLAIAPLYRFTLFKTSTRYVLCCVFHHLIIDSHSLNLFAEWFSTLYKNPHHNFQLPLYTDYLVYQNTLLNSQITNKIKNFWANQLNDTEALIKLPQKNDFAHKKTTNKKYTLHFDLNAELLNAAKEFSEENNVTLFTFFFSVFNIVIHRLIHQDAFYIALPISTRLKSAFANTFGLFTNLLPCKNSMNPNMPFINYLQTSAKELANLYKNSYISHSTLQSLSAFSPKKFYQLLNIAFSLDYETVPALEGLQTKILPTPYVEHKFELTFFLKINHHTPHVLIEFNPEKFSETLIGSLFDAFCYVAKWVLKQPNASLSTISLTEQRKSVLIQRSAAINNDTILHRFAKTVKRYPHQIVVEDKTKHLTFNALDKLSNQFANQLKASGFLPGDRLALFMQHSIGLIITILGILKARCTYVPIHSSTPKERRDYFISQSSAKALFTDSEITTQCNVTKILINAFLTQSRKQSDKLTLTNAPNDLAYIIFTSGSTGNPKGVKVNQHNLSHLFSQTDQILALNNQDRWLLFHSYAFDFSVWEIFGALLSGATLIIPEPSRIQSPEALFKFIIDKQITVLNQTPSAFHIFSTEAIKQVYHHKLPLRYILFGGEPIHNQSLLKWFRYFSSHQPQLVNLYGITEGTIHVTYQFLDEKTIIDNPWGTPIGTPLPGNEILLLDPYQQEVPVGFQGEMYIGGNSVAQGYVKEEHLSSERFIHFNKDDPYPFYKTGDVAIENNNNTFSYLGRNDAQVKISGYRIELKEIESALMSVNAIDNAAIIVDATNALQKTMTAFIVPNQQKLPALSTLTQVKQDKRYHCTTLVNDFVVVDKNIRETQSLYQEIFVEKQYTKKGIHLHDATVIVDVGANIGLFSLFVHFINPNANIYAYEPFEDLCQCIEKNKTIYDANVIVHRMGLSNTAGTKEFAYFPKVTAMSTYDHGENAPFSLLKYALDSENQTAVDTIVQDKLNGYYIKRPVDTLSNQIREQQLTQIDLLKIDVEGAEFDILMGIEDDHWKMIQQIVVEVHDTKNRLRAIIDLLKIQGFFVEFEKYKPFSNTNLYMVYATKQKRQNKTMDVISIRIPTNETKLLAEVRQYLSKKLPSYMLPTYYKIVPTIPTTVNGKTDYLQLKRCLNKVTQLPQPNNPGSDNDKIAIIKMAWETLLHQNDINCDAHFFEIGGTSLLAIQLADRLTQLLGFEVPVMDIFYYSTIRKFADHYASKEGTKPIPIIKQKKTPSSNQNIAIVAINGVFPKADTVSAFWNHLMSGKNCLTALSNTAFQYNPSENFIPVIGVLDNPYHFDAQHFNLSPSEAKMLDPQQRLLLELCYLNLRNAHINFESPHHNVGVFASADVSQYRNLMESNTHTWQKKRRIDYANSRDFIATRIAYKLGLTGPALTINTACSSALSACAQAIQSLRRYECDAAMVCAASLMLPEILPGYYYEPDGILSKDGRCCPFDIHATGTVPGSAAASIVLKRMEDAQKNKDPIIACLQSYSINNDGSDKVGYTAPSISGQKQCLENVYSGFFDYLDQLDYIETHGTGTKMGDAVEIQALSEVLGHRNKIYLGSVKANIGHAGAASGLCGLIKTALILNKRVIPPQIRFTQWNGLCRDAKNYFSINTRPQKLKEGIRYAGVSSFGIGGTNVHLLLRSTETTLPYQEQWDHAVFNNRKKYYYSNNGKSASTKNDDTSACKPAPYASSKEVTDLNTIKHLDFIKNFLQLVADELEIDLNTIKLEHNFFELGGDSLIALGLLSKILKTYQITISMDAFYKAKNLHDIIVMILKKENKNHPKCHCLQNNGERTLVLVHTGGGYVYPYDFFKHLRINNLNIITIENQVLNDMGSDIDSIEAMAKQYIALLDEKILQNELILGGWSFGGSVAYEMAYQLQQKGINPKKVILFDSWAKYPPKYTDFKNFKSVWFRNLEKIYHFEDDAWIKMLWKRLKMLIHYQPPATNLAVTLYKALEVEPVFVIRDDPSNFWAEYTDNLSIININARHQTILEIMQEKNQFQHFLKET